MRVNYHQDGSAELQVSDSEILSIKAALSNYGVALDTKNKRDLANRAWKLRFALERNDNK